ncbi:hypothetical protein DVR12_06960 [Chitinophaga silvatica]|uniref:Metal-dependent HD superfamily phosphohydrolase n=1 Tax=Chitinophaga silvatica TaxID=2282649 RepID=A0A3E1YED4_9BACT|nr:hypothetical protein [Chitinophaga silvatica]RFS24922.1 hypothetical protein DVR12_06960 [Chitinophaga silvatica]
MLTNELKTYWFQLHQAWTSDKDFIEQSFIQLLTAYAQKKRYYHNISHIQSMFSSLNQCSHEVDDAEIIAFSIFFHDIVYDVKKSDNEEKSAEKAELHLLKIGYPNSRITAVRDFIIATKTHINSIGSKDLNYFLDMDLQILGADEATYRAYTQQIRKEYSIYPDFLYKPGRKKVLHHFLEKPFIYHTPVGRAAFEEKARKNISTEITTL